MNPEGSKRPRGRSGGRAGGSGYDFQDLYVGYQLAKLLVGDLDPPDEVIWEKKALDRGDEAGVHQITVDDVVLHLTSDKWVYVQVKETAPAGGWSASQLNRAGVTKQFWKQWISNSGTGHSRDIIRLASGGDVIPLVAMVDAAKRIRTPRELPSNEVAVAVVKEIAKLAHDLKLSPESTAFLAFLKSLEAESLPAASGLESWIIGNLAAFGDRAQDLTRRLVRLVARSKHAGSAARSAFTKESLIAQLQDDGFSYDLAPDDRTMATPLLQPYSAPPFRGQPEPELHSGSFVVRNLAVPQRFYQRQKLSFTEGDFVARSSDGRDLLKTVCSLFQTPACVGLWGEGGSGKTRLAAEAVAQLLSDLPGGVLWLSAAGRARFTLDDVLTDLWQLIGGLDRLDLTRARRAIGRRLEAMGSVLLVLDNLDSVNDPELFRFMVELPGNCSLLFTTKLWLDKEYEYHYQVRVPTLDSHESKELVIQKARGRKLAPEQEKAILQACMGNAWFVVVLVAAAAQSRLRQMLEDLRNGRDPSPEGRAFVTTYQQLTTEGRNALAALSLFQPIASLSNFVETVRLDDVSGALSELRRWGLVEFEDAVDEQKWWVTPGVASTFAQTLPQRTDFESAFAHSLMQLAVRLDHATKNKDEVIAYEQRWEQRHNLLSALAWYGRAVNSRPFNRGIFDDLLRMLRAVSSFLAGAGYWQEVVGHQEQALEVAHRLSDSKRIGEITHRLGRMHQTRALYSEAQQYFEESIRWNANFPLGVARSKHQLGIIAQHLGQYERAESLLKQSLAAKRVLFDTPSRSRSNSRLSRFEIAYSLHGLAVFKLDMGDYQAAHMLARESLAIKREPGVSTLGEISLTQHLLGQILRWREEYVDAEEVFRDNLVLTEKIRNRQTAARTRLELGWLSLNVHNRPDEALRFYEEALQVAHELGIERFEARVLGHLGELLETTGRFADAENAYQRSIEILRDLGEVRELAIVLASFAELLDETGRLKDAIESQRESSNLFRTMNRPEGPQAEARLEQLLAKAKNS